MRNLSPSLLPVIQTLREELHPVAIYVFGSCGTEHETAVSDVDLAVLLPFGHNADLHGLRRDLELTLLRDVDLIDLRTANTVLRKEIVTTGDRVWCADRTAADQFEMVSLSLYQKLCAERAPILAAALKSGRILAS